MTDGTEGAAPSAGGPEAPAWRGPSRRRWALFAAVALAVLLADQATKALVAAAFAVGEGTEVLGEWLRIVHWRNSGILFGLLPRTAPAFALVSLLVIAGLVWYHRQAGRGILLTLALALLLGGALGNLVDRLRWGSVLDFVDMGIGAWRFYTYNVADAAITTAVVLLLGLSLVPRLADLGPDG